MEIINIVSEDEDEVKILFDCTHSINDTVSSSRGSLQNKLYEELSQIIVLLKAFAASSKDVPTAYHLFFNFAREFDPTLPDHVIMMAYKRLIQKETENLKAATAEALSDPLAGEPQSETPENPLMEILLIDEDEHSLNYFSERNVSDRQGCVCMSEQNASDRQECVCMSERNVSDRQECVRSDLEKDSSGNYPHLNSDVQKAVTFTKKRKNKNTNKSFENSNSTKKRKNKDTNKSFENSNSTKKRKNKDTNKSLENSNASHSENIGSSKPKKCKAKSSCSSANLTRNETEALVKSNTGVKAKIKKIRLSSTNEIKTMSNAEFKRFLAEQKRQELVEKKKLATQELEKVHDRLVDVLIPKYHNKNL